MHHNWRGPKLWNINFLQNQQSVWQGWKRLVLTLHRGGRCERAHGRQSIDCQRATYASHQQRKLRESQNNWGTWSLCTLLLRNKRQNSKIWFTKAKIVKYDLLIKGSSASCQCSPIGDLGSWQQVTARPLRGSPYSAGLQGPSHQSQGSCIGIFVCIFSWLSSHKP